LVWLAAKCPRFTFVDTIIVPTKAIILTYTHFVHTSQIGRLQIAPKSCRRKSSVNGWENEN
ncbi:MAG: hypothetical protein WBD23_11145, partial [Candidatus Acidiferrales bacterium]